MKIPIRELHVNAFDGNTPIKTTSAIRRLPNGVRTETDGVSKSYNVISTKQKHIIRLLDASSKFASPTMLYLFRYFQCTMSLQLFD